MSKSKKRLPFEDAMKRLDAIVTAMEAGDIGIEESVTQYQEAMKLAARCRAILQDAEQRIQKIQLDPDGRPSAVPFGEPTVAEENGP